jgi:spermidine/putrescine transport system substrate-binding protein
VGVMKLRQRDEAGRARALRAVSFAFVAASGIAALAGRCEERAQAPLPPRDVVFYNWERYTDLPSLAEFEKETGFHVVLEEFGTTDEALAQLQTNPGAFDVVLGDSENAPLLRDTKLVAPLDLSRIPNAGGVEVKLRDAAAYAIPFTGAVTGLAVDTSMVPDAEISWRILLDPRYQGRIAVLDDMREVTDALAMIAGTEVGPRADLRALREAGVRLAENRISFGDTLDNLRGLLAGEKWIAMTYNGDFAINARSRKNLRFALPVEGYRVEYDCFSVCADAKNPVGAHALIDFLLRPEIAARWTNEFGFKAIVRGASRYYDRNLLADPVVSVPFTDPRARAAAFLGDLTPRYEQLYHQLRRGT